MSEQREIGLHGKPGNGLPFGWTTATVGSLATDVKHIAYGVLKPGPFVESGPPMLKVTDIRTNRVEDSLLHRISSDLHKEFKRTHLSGGEVLISIQGTVGRVAIVPDHHAGSNVSRTLAVVPPKAKDLAPWMRWALLSPLGQQRMRKRTGGTTRDSLNLRDLRVIELPIAPLPEQHRIVAEIETQFTRLDAAVATLKRVQANLKRARASVLKAAVEGRLVSTEAELARAEGRPYEPASVLLERILVERRRKHDETQVGAKRKKKYKEPVQPDTKGLPELPEGWVWASIDVLITKGPTNGIYVPKKEYGAGTPILRITDFQDGWSRSGSELQQVQIDPPTEAKYALAEHDLVVNRVNSPSHLGKSMVVEPRHLPAVFESNMMRMTPASGVLPFFIDYWLRSFPGRQRLIANAKWAVNQASINQTDVKTTPLPLPPKPEQARIVAEIQRQFSVLDALEQTVERNLLRCTRLRQSILKRAFEGKLVPQDPSDEHASELLARIQAQSA